MKRWVVGKGPTDKTFGHVTVREEDENGEQGREVAQFLRREDAEDACWRREAIWYAVDMAQALRHTLQHLPDSSDDGEFTRADAEEVLRHYREYLGEEPNKGKTT